MTLPLNSGIWALVLTIMVVYSCNSSPDGNKYVKVKSPVKKEKKLLNGNEYSMLSPEIKLSTFALRLQSRCDHPIYHAEWQNKERGLKITEHAERDNSGLTVNQIRIPDYHWSDNRLDSIGTLIEYRDQRYIMINFLEQYDPSGSIHYYSYILVLKMEGNKITDHLTLMHIDCFLATELPNDFDGDSVLDFCDVEDYRSLHQDSLQRLNKRFGFNEENYFIALLRSFAHGITKDHYKMSASGGKYYSILGWDSKSDRYHLLKKFSDLDNMRYAD